MRRTLGINDLVGYNFYGDNDQIVLNITSNLIMIE